MILLSQENSFVFHETLPESDKMLQLATPFPFMENPRAHPNEQFEPKEVKQGSLRDCPATLGIKFLQCLAEKKTTKINLYFAASTMNKFNLRQRKNTQSLRLSFQSFESSSPTTAEHHRDQVRLPMVGDY